MVYHLAANSDIQKGGKDPKVDYDLTFNTTFHVLQYLKEFGIRKLFLPLPPLFMVRQVMF